MPKLYKKFHSKRFLADGLGDMGGNRGHHAPQRERIMNVQHEQNVSKNDPKADPVTPDTLKNDGRELEYHLDFVDLQKKGPIQNCDRHKTCLNCPMCRYFLLVVQIVTNIL